MSRSGGGIPRIKFHMGRERGPKWPCRAEVAVVVFALWIVGCVSGRELHDRPNDGFFLPHLPLEIIATYPSFLKDSPSNRVIVEGGETLIVVFSRPVIGIGADFGVSKLPNNKIPFFLDPPVRGMGRWVTTYIYRFDSEKEWPLDTNIMFRWNKDLETHDGNRLSYHGKRDAFVFSTPSLSASEFNASMPDGIFSEMRLMDFKEGSSVVDAKDEKKEEVQDGDNAGSVHVRPESVTGITDNESITNIGNLGEEGTVHALTHNEEKFMSMSDIESYSNSWETTQTSLVLDRKLVKPKESLHVKGYAMTLVGINYSPAKFKNIEIRVSPALNKTRACSDCPDIFPVSVSDTFGSFEMVIPIPEDAPDMPYKVELWGEKPDFTGAYVIENFAVGDPRPPTAELTIDAPLSAPPWKSVTVGVIAKSFTGATVSDAEMTLTWSVWDMYAYGEQPDQWRGKATIRTDSEGKGEGVIDIASWWLKPSSGSRLDVTVQWIGPTRELIEKSATIRLQQTNLGSPMHETDETRMSDQEFGVELIQLSKGPYKIGDTVRFGIKNPFANSTASISWGGPQGQKHKVVPLQDSSLDEFSIDVDGACVVNCGVQVTVSIPKQSRNLAGNSRIPLKKGTTNQKAPQFVSLWDDIIVDLNQTIPIAMKFPGAAVDKEGTPVLAPGTSAIINITLEADQDAEVTVMAVDKAMLELIENDLKRLEDDFPLDASIDFGGFNSKQSLIAHSGAERLVAGFGMQQKHAQQTNVETKMNPSQPAQFEPPRDMELDNSSTDRTITSFDDSDGMVDVSIGGAVDGSSDAKPKEPTTGPSLDVRHGFVSTALFETTTTKDGIATVNLTVPENVGTFVVRAYAATGTGKFGSSEVEVIVRRTVSLTPSAPRFARVGDEFQAGAVVALLGNSTSVTVSILLEGASGNGLEIMGNDSLTFKMDSQGQKEVRFSFLARQMGDAAFTITADAGVGGQDALVVSIPVEGLQEQVSVASSFAIDGGGGDWQEGLSLPDAVPGSGSVNFQAGVGRMPAILSLARQIYDVNPMYKCPVSSDFALAATAIPLVAETYEVIDMDGGGGRVVKGVLDGMVSNFTAGIHALQELTNKTEGLQQYTTCPDSGIDPWVYFNLQQTARAVWIMSELDTGKANINDKEMGGDGVKALRKLLEYWLDSLVKGVVKEARDHRELYRQPLSITSVVIARFALGGDWVPPSQTPKQIVKDLSMNRLRKGFSQLSVENQAKYILIRLAMQTGKRHPHVRRATKQWMDRFRVGARTAYIAPSDGYAHAASNEAHSLILMAFVRAGIDNALVEKLANYVGNPPVDEYGFWVYGIYDKLVAMLALREYDMWKGSNQSDMQLEIRSGNTSLMSYVFNESTVPVTSSSSPWEELGDPPMPVEFKARGTGQVTIAASLKFIPAKLLPFPTYKGIFVKRMIRITGQGEGFGKFASHAAVPVGSIVDVTAHVTTPDVLGPTTVRVLMPSGLEPIDPNVEEGEVYCPMPLAGSFEIQDAFTACPTPEASPDTVIFRFKALSPGTHSVSFRAVAAVVGNFALPPVRAFVDDQPELMGLSSAGQLTVCSVYNCTDVKENRSTAPQTCLKDCHNNGVCNLATGTCMCLEGFWGDDCGIVKTD